MVTKEGSASEFTERSFAKGETPKFPLKDGGKIWHQGWDIPSYWAIDADNVPYADYGAHGCSMTRTTFGELIREMENSEDGAVSRVRKLAGKKPGLPSWARKALEQGWTPPPGFKRENYDE